MSAGPSCVRLSEGSDTTTSRSADASQSGRSVDSARTAVRVDLSCVEAFRRPRRINISEYINRCIGTLDALE